MEILSPGTTNEQRDRDAKRKLYSRRGVGEYWIADPHHGTIEVYRRQDLAVQLVATLQEDDTLEMPLLPSFRLSLRRIFRRS